MGLTRGAGLEKLGDTWKTPGDIGGRGHTTGVEERSVSWAPCSPMDWAATIPTVSPTSTSLLVARDQPARRTPRLTRRSARTALRFPDAVGHEVVGTSMDSVALVHGSSVGRVDVGEQMGGRATVGGLDEHQVAVVVALGDADGQTGLCRSPRAR